MTTAPDTATKLKTRDRFFKKLRLYRFRRLGRGLIASQAFLTYAFLYIPILVLVIYSFNVSKSGVVWRGFTLDWYKSLFQGGGVLGLGGVDNSAQQFAGAGIVHSFQNSLIVAAFSTVISTIVGTMAAMGMERFRFKLRGVLDVVLYLPIIIPDITMALSLAIFFNLVFAILRDADVIARFGIATIIISHIAFNISFVAVVVRSRLAGMDRSLEEAAQDAGANEWQTFRYIVLPLIMPGVVGGALLAFTLSLDDFVISFFTAGIGSSTLPMFVYGMIKFTVTPAINAISTLMMLASMVLVITSLLIQRR